MAKKRKKSTLGLVFSAGAVLFCLLLHVVKHFFCLAVLRLLNALVFHCKGEEQSNDDRQVERHDTPEHHSGIDIMFAEYVLEKTVIAQLSASHSSGQRNEG